MSLRLLSHLMPRNSIYKYFSWILCVYFELDRYLYSFSKYVRYIT